MFENLKRMAIQRLAQKMAGNALSSEATGAAATQGAGAILDSIKSKLAGGDMSQIQELFSGGNLESNELFQNAKSKMAEVLQGQGMSAEEATAEAEATTPDLISGLKEKFDSKDEADAEFDLSSLSKWIPADAGGLLSKAKDLLG